MYEPSDDVEARRLCRVYVKVFDAGPAGASVEPMDALGPADLMHRRGTGDAGLVRRLLDDGLLDRVPAGGDHARWALPPKMREALDREVAPGVSRASRLRVLLDRVDEGEAGLDEAFGRIERAIRTGFP